MANYVGNNVANNAFVVNLLKVAYQTGSTEIGTNYIYVKDSNSNTSLFIMNSDVTTSVTTIDSNILFNQLPNVEYVEINKQINALIKTINYFIKKN